jgi:HAD superfamily hydrolase (TIGR01509 family)
MPRPHRPAFLFDLDGTLVDSVYQHVLAWREVLEQVGINLSVWRIHRRIGMSGGLFVNALLRETDRPVTAEEIARLRELHVKSYLSRIAQIRPLPGARELLARFAQQGVRWAIATSGNGRTAQPMVDMLDVPKGTIVITRDDVERAKPDPDLFLAAAERLGVPIEESMVVGDGVRLVWQAPIACTKTPPICSATWTRSGSGRTLRGNWLGLGPERDHRTAQQPERRHQADQGA